MSGDNILAEDDTYSKETDDSETPLLFVMNFMFGHHTEISFDEHLW